MLGLGIRFTVRVKFRVRFRVRTGAKASVSFSVRHGLGLDFGPVLGLGYG